MRDFSGTSDPFHVSAKPFDALSEHAGAGLDASAGNIPGAGLGLVLLGSLVGAVAFLVTLVMGGGLLAALLLHGLAGSSATLALAVLRSFACVE